MGQNDAASYLTEANSITVDNDGLGDRVVGANDGAILASFTADVDFDVVDSAQAIAAELNGTIAPGMVQVAWMRQMMLLVAVLWMLKMQQLLCRYLSTTQLEVSYEISDDVASVISAGSGVIEDDGVFKVDVTGIADASEGVALNTYFSEC